MVLYYKYYTLLKPLTCSKKWTRTLTGTSRNIQVSLIGNCGRVGGSLSLLLKQNIYISKLHVYDEAEHTLGVALDLSHIESKTKVRSFRGEKKLEEALHGANIVIIVQSNDRVELPTDDDCRFTINGKQLFERMKLVAQVCPESLICLCVEPLNCMMPIATKAMRIYGCYDPRKIFGVTTLDVVRANTFASRHIKADPLEVNVPVIGGHDGRTITPLFSQCTPCFDASCQIYHQLVRRVQCAEEYVQQKGKVDGMGVPHLAQAYAIARFVYALCCALAQRPGIRIVECSMVRSTIFSDVPYFASPIELGRHGVCTNLGIPVITKKEEELIECSLERIKKDIAKGANYAARQVELETMKYHI